MPRKILLGLLLANSIHFGVGGFFSNSGVALTSAVNAGFLVKFALVTTILLAWIFLKEKMTVTKAISASIMILGGYLLSTKGQSLIPQVGDVLIVLACLAWSIGNILVRKAIKDSNISGDIVSLSAADCRHSRLLVFYSPFPLLPSTNKECVYS